MKKNRLLYILLAFLIIVNGFLLFNHFTKPNDRRGRGEPRDFISKELKFNETQKAAYTKLFDEHRLIMRDLDSKIRILKDSFFSNIALVNVDAVQVDSLASLIAENETKKDLELLEHFKQVYKICDESQKEDFQNIIKKSLRRINKKRRPKKRD